MDQEQLIQTIMSEIMKDLGNDSVVFRKKGTEEASAGSSASSAGGARVGREQYPLGEHVPDRIRSSTGKVLSDFTLAKVKSGELKAEDFRISKETLEMQAQVAESVDRGTLANNMRRASELIAVPDDKLLTVYDSLRPYRSSKQELYDLADELEQKYDCTINAAFIRQAADVYEMRGRLKKDD